MPFHGSQVLMGTSIPYPDGAIIISTTREELVAVEGETHHTKFTGVKFRGFMLQGSQVLVGIGIPHTDGAITIITTGEELVVVEDETPHTMSMPFQGSQVLVGIGIPHADSAITTTTTTREELVAVEDETPNITIMRGYPSHADRHHQVLVGIGIPHTDGAIMITTTGEELVAVEGETSYTISMPLQLSKAFVSTEEEALKHALQGGLI